MNTNAIKENQEKDINEITKKKGATKSEEQRNGMRLPDVSATLTGAAGGAVLGSALGAGLIVPIASSLLGGVLMGYFSYMFNKEKE